MLINISETKLLKKDDTNVFVSCISKDPMQCTPQHFKSLWLSAIRNSLGHNITESTEAFILRVHNRRQELLTTTVGSDIIKVIAENFEPNSIRIDLSNSDEVMSFIILLKYDII